MMRYFIEGNYILMSILSFLFLIILSLSVVTCLSLFKSGSISNDHIKKQIGYIRSIALFTLILGIFYQLLRLFQVFDFLSSTGNEITSSIIAGGLKLTFNTTFFGIIIYLVSLLVTLGFKIRLNGLS